MRIIFFLTLFLMSVSLQAREIGSVSSTFKMLGPNDKIVVESFDDPDVKGVSCYLSRAKRGGISGAIGFAEDTSDASIACRETGKVVVSNNIKDGDQVLKKSTNIFFKTLQVVRFYDKEKNVLIYLSYSDKLIDGSPKNSISIVPVR